MKKYTVKEAKKLSGEVRVLGDKSISHRTVMLGSIARGITTVENFLRSDDCLHTIDCFKKMGVPINFEGDKLVIEGKGLNGLCEPSDIFDVGNSGTTIRLLMGILAAQKFHSTLTGDESIRRRPMGRVIEPLKKMGALIHGRDHDTLAPMTVIGKELKPITYNMPVASAQVKSAVLFAGLYANGATTVIEKEPTRDHTERMMEFFGAKIKTEHNSITIEGKHELSGREVFVPGDISSAAFPIVAAACIKDSRIIVKDVGVNPGRTGLIDVLHRMGADIEVTNERLLANEPVADIEVKYSQMNGIEISGGIIPRIIDEIPIIAVAATQANGKTVIKGAEELRVKESDRIKTTVKELKRLGANIEEARDGFVIYGPARLSGAVCQSYNDHRIAMICAVAGLIAKGTTIVEKVECVETSFPTFPEVMNALSGRDQIILS